MCLEEDISIVRYVGSNAAKSIISANSTFLLRSLQYYQDLEILSNDKTRGDRREGEVEFSDGSVSSWNPQSWLISCWCKYEVAELNWELFDDNSWLAIISTRQKVKSMLDKACSSVKPILMTISIRFVLNPIKESRNVSTTISCVPRQVMVLGQISIGEGN